jgi:hypothetical protein
LPSYGGLYGEYKIAKYTKTIVVILSEAKDLEYQTVMSFQNDSFQIFQGKPIESEVTWRG